MPGYPCCCKPGKPQCGACQGTAPAQYQLTVPDDLFSGTVGSGSCGERCGDYSGVFLLDYNPDLTPITGEGVTCIWESPGFEVCYLFTPANPELGIFEDIVNTEVWRWRIELSDQEIPADEIRAYVFLRSDSYNYTWVGYFTDNDCGQEIDITWVPAFLQNPMPGCNVDEDEILTLEPAP
jgi:hypothetical protein